MMTTGSNRPGTAVAAIAAAAEQIKAESFTIDGEAVVLGPDGLSRSEELLRRDAANSEVLYAFDLIEHDGEDMRNHPFLDPKNTLAQQLRNAEVGILFNEHIAEDRRIPPASPCSGRGARYGIDEPQAARAR